MEGGPPRFPRGSTCPAVLGSSRHVHRQPFAYRALTLYGRPSQVVRLDRSLTRGSHRSRRATPTTPRRHRRWAVPPPRFGLCPFRSPLLRASRLISCPRGTEMFQFPRCASIRLCVQRMVTGLHPVGLPHSEIPGSKPVCGSPRLIAACRVLLRPRAPRHPPYALLFLGRPHGFLRGPEAGPHRPAPGRPRSDPPRVPPRPGPHASCFPAYRATLPRSPPLARSPRALVPLHLSRCNTGALGTSHRESAERFGPPCGGPSLRTVPVRVVGIGRLELPTSPLSGARSDHLSYMPAPNAARRSRRADGLATEKYEGNASVDGETENRST